MSFRDMVRIATHDPDEPAVLLRDTPEDRERLLKALVKVEAAPQWSCTMAHFDGEGHSMPCPDNAWHRADAIIAALAEPMRCERPVDFNGWRMCGNDRPCEEHDEPRRYPEPGEER